MVGPPKQPSSALLGNGSLLVSVSGRGRIEGMWWPHPDREQHLGELRLGIELDGMLRWLDEEPFAWTQLYLDSTSLLRTVARTDDVEVEIDDLVHESEPIVVRRITCSRRVARLVVRCRPELGEHTRKLAVNVDEETGALVFYRAPFALALDTLAASVASAEGIGWVEGAISCPLDGSAELVCALGTSPSEALEVLGRALASSHEQLAERRRRHDASRVGAAKPPLDAGLKPLYERSLLVFDCLRDRATGAVIAAPEVDPDFVHSGGYGFVWARDLAFCVLAFLASGRRDLAEAAARWFPVAQDPAGLWLQRHWTDGSLAPSWCAHQLDETGGVLFAYEAAWRELGDRKLDAELWPSARAAADFLLGAVGENGLPCETADLWEEREGCHAFTAAATVGGLCAAAAFAARHEPELAEPYAQAAEAVREALERSFWSDEHGRYLRTLGDPTVDVSLLGLAWPFAAVDPRGDRMRSTAAAIERTLGRSGGGVLRYQGDRYAGGNPWVLAALWLGLWRRQIGDVDGHERALAYARRVATPLNLLAEQVTDDGSPAWVLPLAWSHALLVLAARPELDVVRDRTAAASSPVRAAN